MMVWALSLIIAISTIIQHAIAVPNAAKLEKRVIATSYCFQDNLYRSFIDSKTSASASSFCSTYLQATVTTATTTTATVTYQVVERGNEQKRALGATTIYPASRLSSACSCILTAKPTTTTVYSTTITVLVTATTTSTSSSSSQSSTSSIPTTTTTSSSKISTITSTSDTSTTTSSTSSTSSTASSTTTVAGSSSTNIVQNAGFETGDLAPWTVSKEYPGPVARDYYHYGLTNNADKSTWAFGVTDNAANSYFDVDLSQTLNTSPGQMYNIAARYFMTDAYDGPQTFVTVNIDGKRVATSKFSDAHTPPQYASLSGSFTATGSQATLTVSFVATDYLSVTWGLDNVAIVPA